jgi:hypothetical protein
VAAAPVAALIAETNIAKTVVDAAIEADILTPIAAVEAVMVMVVTPVTGRPQSALIGSLNPRAWHPVIVPLIPTPVAGRPEIAVSGSLRLIVVR